MEKMNVLIVNNLSKNFTSGFWSAVHHTYTAVNTISFELRKGEILGFLGPNGAGKTTTIQMLLGVLMPTSGSIYYFGDDFAQHSIAALKRIGYASGYDSFPARLTVTENLDVVGRIYGLGSQQRVQRIEMLLKFFGIWNARDKQVGGLSAGQTTRVMLAKAFLSNPDIVLLDEPTASLDPDVAYEVRQFILRQSQEHNTAVLITSHNMVEVTELCNRVLVLKQGVIIADNTPEELARSVSQARVHLALSDKTDEIVDYMNSAELKYSVTSHMVTVTLDEHDIAHFLSQIALRGIMYSHISIDKPTLEDYFMTIAKQQEKL